MNYPHPCENCPTGCYDPNSVAKNCSQYRKWVNAWWLHFNGIYRKLCRAHRMVSQRFLYEHPDEIRRYLRDGPCARCTVAENCDTPCAAYWRWWDARMEWFRKGVGL